MSTTRILYSADWHLDQSNIRYTLPPVDRLIEIAEEQQPDLIIHGGDFFVHRGNIHPEITWLVRDRLHRLAFHARAGLLAISGNHDQVFQAGLHDGLAGAVALHNDSDDTARSIHCATTATGPRVIRLDNVSGLSFILIPTVNKYWLHSQTETEDKLDAGALLTSMVQSLILAEKAAGRDPIVVYHGTFSGATLSNEQVMTAGMDIALPQTAVNGAAVVLAGHIHHAQTLDGPGCKIHYPGSIAPLTWNDKRLEPRALLVEVEHDDQGKVERVEVTPIPLPVVSQMIEHEVPDNWQTWALNGETVELALYREIERAGASPGDRLRLKINAPGAVLQQITDNLLDKLAEKHGLEHIKAIRERSDADRIEFATDRRISITDAFARWLALRPGDQLSDQDHEDLVAICRELEGQVEDEHLDACYDYQPETLIADNWCQYDHLDIDFGKLGSLVAIRGANTAGKSNAVRALIFALYKHQVSGDVLADLIRKGEKVADVWHTFVSHGQRYRIRRTLKRSGERGATAQLFFERYHAAGEVGPTNPAEWQPLAEGDARETEAAIRALVGPPELFLATTYAGQADVDGLLDLGPAEFRDLLQSVLQRDFAGRQKVIRAWQATAERTRDLAMTLYDRAADAAAGAEAIQTDLDMAAACYESVKRDAEAIDLAGLEQAAAQASQRTAELKGQLAATSGDADRQPALAAELDEVRRKARSAREAGAALTSAREDLCNILDHEPEPPEVDVRAAEAAHDTDSRALADAQKQHGDELRAEWPKGDAAKKAVRDAEIAAARARDDNARAGERLADLERRAALVGDVPCGGRVWMNRADDLVDLGACPLLADAKQAAALVGEARRTVEATATAVELADQALNTAKTREFTWDAAYSNALSRHREREAVLAASAAATKTALDETREAARKRQEWIHRTDALRATIDRLRPLADQLPALEARDLAIRQELDRIREAGEARGALVRQVATVEREAATAADLLASGRRRHQEATRAAQDAAQRIATLTERLEAARKAAAEAEGHRAEIVAQERRQRLCSVLLDALGRDGVPQLLLEQFALPELRALVNGYLEETSFSVEIEAQRQLVSGEGRPGVYITFSDHRGTHPVSAASGQQRVALGSAIRNALAALHAQALGSRIWLTIQDEGFGALDPENREAAKVTLRRIAKDRRWFLYISHVEGLSEIADSVLEAVAVNGASRLEVIR